MKVLNMLPALVVHPVFAFKSEKMNILYLDQSLCKSYKVQDVVLTLKVFVSEIASDICQTFDSVSYTEISNLLPTTRKSLRIEAFKVQHLTHGSIELLEEVVIVGTPETMGQ